MARFLGPLGLAGRNKLAARSGLFLSNPSGYGFVRIVAAAVLLVAAGLKAHQLATEPIIGSSILESRWFLMLTVEFELFFGLWLLANILPRATWAATLGCFGLFACVSLYKALSGAASCGCFGRVPVNPWYTTTLDVAIVLSLLRWRPRQLPSPVCGKEAGGEGRLPRSVLSIPKEAVHRAMVVILSWLAIGLPAGYAMGSYADTTLSDVGIIASDGKTVVLEPDQWQGKRFPLLTHIDICRTHSAGKPNEWPLRERLAEGKWLVLLYHHDCNKCQEVLRYLRRIIRTLDVQQVALIEVPPCAKVCAKVDDTLDFSGVSLIYARLPNTRKWFVESPVGLVLDNGITVDFRNRSDLLKNM